MKKITIQQIENAMPIHTIIRSDSGIDYYTLNSLIYNIRVTLKMQNVCLASEDGFCISNVSRTYVPTRHLAQFVKITEIDCENNAIFFEWVIHPTKGKYNI